MSVAVLEEAARNGDHAALLHLHAVLIADTSFSPTLDMLKIFSSFLSSKHRLDSSSHIAARTPSVPLLGIDSIASALVALNIVERTFIKATSLYDTRLFASITDLSPAIISWFIILLPITPELGHSIVAALGNTLCLLLSDDTALPIIARNSDIRSLFPILLDTWIYLSQLRSQTRDELVTYTYDCVICNLLMIFHEDKMLQLADVGAAAIEARVDDFSATLATELSMLTGRVGRSTGKIPSRRFSALILILHYAKRGLPARRSLARSGILPILCRAFHKAVRLEIDVHTEYEFMQDIFMFLQLGIGSFLPGPPESSYIPALREKLLPSVLRMQHLVTKWASSHLSSDWHKLSQEIEVRSINLIEQLNAATAFESCRRLFQSSIKYIELLVEMDELKPSGNIWNAFTHLQTHLVLYGAEKRIGRSTKICTSPSCVKHIVWTENDSIPMRGHRCSGCLLAEYCSLSCQKVHWKEGGHRGQCSKIKKARADLSSLGPYCPRDIDFIHAIAERKLQKDILAREEFKKQKWLFSIMNEVIVVNFTCINHGWPDNGHDTMLGVDLLTLFWYDFLEQTRELHIDFEQKQWLDLLDRKGLQTPYVAIIVCSRLVQLTDLEGLKARVYPVGIFT